MQFPADGPLPDRIPVFPLGGVLLLPRGELPLNIFEPRYLAMVEDALRAERLIGMVQPCGRSSCGGEPPLYAMGCAGRITRFSETADGRNLVTLTGVSRFRIAGELPQRKGYRLALADWDGFAGDRAPVAPLVLDRERLRHLLSAYFDLHSLSCNWTKIDEAPDERLLTCLSMICPLDAGEKQALLEAPDPVARAGMFMEMLELAVRSGRPPQESRICH